MKKNKIQVKMTSMKLKIMQVNNCHLNYYYKIKMKNITEKMILYVNGSTMGESPADTASALARGCLRDDLVLPFWLFGVIESICVIILWIRSSMASCISGGKGMGLGCEGRQTTKPIRR